MLKKKPICYNELEETGNGREKTEKGLACRLPFTVCRLFGGIMEFNIKVPQKIRITKKHILALTTVALLVFGYEKMGSETLTLHAYYPSPVGIYTRLVSINRASFARDKGNVLLLERNPTGMVGIGTTEPQAKLDVVSTNNGFLPPRYADPNVIPLANRKDGLMVYNTGSHQLVYWDDNVKQWKSSGGSPLESAVVSSYFVDMIGSIPQGDYTDWVHVADYEFCITTRLVQKYCALTYEYVSISGRCGLSPIPSGQWKLCAGSASGEWIGCIAYCLR